MQEAYAIVHAAQEIKILASALSRAVFFHPCRTLCVQRKIFCALGLALLLNLDTRIYSFVRHLFDGIYFSKSSALKIDLHLTMSPT